MWCVVFARMEHDESKTCATSASANANANASASAPPGNLEVLGIVQLATRVEGHPPAMTSTPTVVLEYDSFCMLSEVHRNACVNLHVDPDEFVMEIAGVAPCAWAAMNTTMLQDTEVKVGAVADAVLRRRRSALLALEPTTTTTTTTSTTTATATTATTTATT